MATRKSINRKAPPNYDYTAPDRVARKRKALKEVGGSRVEASLNELELRKLDALVRSGAVGTSRNAVLKYLVGQLPDPQLPDESAMKTR